MSIEKYEISADESGKKIYHFLKARDYSERVISRLRQKGCLKVNKIDANMRTILKKGDILEIHLQNSNKTTIAECDGELDILFEDEDFLIVNKPAMLACTPTRSHYTNNLGGQICKYMQKDENFTLRILNRLDFDTSGIVVVAKNTLACKTKIEKEYHALVEGEIDQKITIDLPIETLKDSDGRNVRKRIISKNGKKAVTHVTPLEVFDTRQKETFNKSIQTETSFNKEEKFTLISVKIETGRTHQIRVHLSHINHPLLGDSLYNKKEENSHGHSMLILKKITFTHFRTKETLSFEVPYPEDFQLPTAKNA